MEFQVYVISLISFPWIPFQFQYEVSLWCNVLTMDVFPISVQNTLWPFIISCQIPHWSWPTVFYFAQLAIIIPTRWMQRCMSSTANYWPGLMTSTQVLNQFAKLPAKIHTIGLLSWIIQQEMQSWKVPLNCLLLVFV